MKRYSIKNCKTHLANVQYNYANSTPNIYHNNQIVQQGMSNNKNSRPVPSRTGINASIPVTTDKYTYTITSILTGESQHTRKSAQNL